MAGSADRPETCVHYLTTAVDPDSSLDDGEWSMSGRGVVELSEADLDELLLAEKGRGELAPPTNRGAEIRFEEKTPARAMGEAVRLQAEQLVNAAKLPDVRFRVDWLSVTVRRLPLEQVLAYLVDEFLGGCSFDEDVLRHFKQEGRTAHYEHFLTCPAIEGLGILAGHREAARFGGEDHVHVQFKGKACAHLGDVKLHRFLRLIENACGREGWKVSRVDGAFDGVPFTPADVYKAVLRGDVRSRIKFGKHRELIEAARQSGDFSQVRRKSCRSFQISEAGSTCTLGAAKSSFRQCTYDMRGETRNEVRFTDRKAEYLGRLLVTANVEEWPGIFLRESRSVFEVIDRRGRKNVSDCKPAAWWSRYILAVGGTLDRVRRVAQVKKVQVRSSCQDVQSAIRQARSLVRRFVMLGKVLPEAAISMMMGEAEQQLTESQQRRVEYLSAAVQSVKESFGLREWHLASDVEFCRVVYGSSG